MVLENFTLVCFVNVSLSAIIALELNQQWPQVKGLNIKLLQK
jgi:hypothetical protein